MTMADRCKKGLYDDSDDHRSTRRPLDEDDFSRRSFYHEEGGYIRGSYYHEDGGHSDSAIFSHQYRVGHTTTPHPTTPHTTHRASELTHRVRDSGYNTDVSPARTSSSTSTPADNFSFDYPDRTIAEDPSSNIIPSHDSATALSDDRQYSPKPFRPRSRSSLFPTARSNSPVGAFHQPDEYCLYQRHRYGLEPEGIASMSLSHSAPGRHDRIDVIIEQSRSPSRDAPFVFTRRPQIRDQRHQDDITDAVDGRGDNVFSSFDRSDSLDANYGTPPLLPSSMSASFVDFPGGDEDDENDLMTSSEEKDNEERFQQQATRKRVSLRRRNYSDSADEEEDEARSDASPSYCRRIGRSVDALPFSHFMTASDGCGRDHISPELTNSIKNACQWMVGYRSDSKSDENQDGSVASGSDKSGSSDKNLLPRDGEHFARDNDKNTLDSDDDNDDGNEDNNPVSDEDDDDDVFTFEMDDINRYHGNEAAAAASSSGPEVPLCHPQIPTIPPAVQSPALPSRVVTDRPPISPSSATRSRPGGKYSCKSRQSRSIPAKLQLAGGATLPWEEGLPIPNVSTGTQTPHMASTMIQELVNTPVALPNQARGTAYLHIRRGSVDMTAMLEARTAAPLPDIVPVPRLRAQSAPNLQAILRRQQAQRAGRELRRLSDLFHENVVRRSSTTTPPEEANPVHQSSSYPRMGHSFFRDSMRVFAFLSRPRRGSSVDDDSFPEVDDSDS